MKKRPIIIWGAGRIGRGFVADVFSHPDHQLVLVDIFAPMIEQLQKRSHYAIFRADASGIHETRIEGYEAFLTTDTTQLMPYFLGISPIVSVTGFASKVQELADMMAVFLRVRAEKTPDDPFDIVLSINMMHPEQAFRAALEIALKDTPNALAYLEDKVGVVPSVVSAITPDTPKEYLDKDPLAIFNNNYPELIIGAKGLKGNKLPKLPKLRLSDDIDAEETRKIYTLNMSHALSSYLSMGKGYKLMIEAAKDPVLRTEIEAALMESAIGLMGEYGFTKAEMDKWNAHILTLLDNPYISDDLIRLGSDSKRKLGHDDRLVGAALLSLKYGGVPKTLAHAIRRGFDYVNEDEGTLFVQNIVSTKGLPAALSQVSGLFPGEKLYDMIMNT